MATRVVTIANPQGLHARPAALFSTEAQRFSSDIWVRNITTDGDFVDAKSVMAVLGIDLSMGDGAELEAEGDDAQNALDALVTLIEEL